MGYIYKIENMLNHKMYIGKTDYFNVNRRWNEHLRAINREDCKNRALYRAMKKYGVENFEFSVIEETENTAEREAYWINLLHTYSDGYNETLGGDGRAYVSVDIEELKAFYANHNFSETSEYFKISPKTLRNIMKQNNIEIESSQSVMKNNSTSVLQLTLDGEVVRTYNSCHEAEMIISGVNSGHISKVCRGKRKSAYGYKWQYAA